jgi:hypothetical protein
MWMNYALSYALPWLVPQIAFARPQWAAWR